MRTILRLPAAHDAAGHPASRPFLAVKTVVRPQGWLFRSFVLLLSACLLALLALPAGAQSPDPAAASDEALFGGDDVGVTEVPQAESRRDLEAENLERRSLEIGGNISAAGLGTIGWSDTSAAPNAWEASPELSALLFVDSRPDRNFRVYASAKADYPFDSEYGVKLWELFADLSLPAFSPLGAPLTIRAGKQTVKWGVGWFYSPSDLLNIGRINPEDHEAPREGPVAAKITLPMERHALYLYALAENAAYWADVICAPRADIVIGPAEFGIGGIFQEGHTAKGVLSLTVPFFDVDLMGETLVQYGSDTSFALSGKKSDQWFVSATAGMSYLNQRLNLTLLGQYWYDAEAQIPSDLSLIGHHRLAGTLILDKLFGSRAGISALCLSDLSDGSGWVKPALFFKPDDRLTITASLTAAWGDANDTFLLALSGRRLAVALEIKLSDKF